MSVFHLVFDGAPVDDLIAIGSVRPSKKVPKPHLHAEFPIPAGKLDVIAPHLLADDPDRLRYLQFVSYRAEACAITRAGHSISYRGKPVWFSAMNEQVKNVYALTLDLDFGRDGRPSAEEGYRDVRRLIDEAHLPQPTLVCFSGRGLYLVYLVRGADGGPVQGSEESLEQRTMIVEDLIERARDVFPDAGASGSLARWFKATAPARYFRFDPEGSGEVRIWSFDSMIDFGLGHPLCSDTAVTFSAVPQEVCEEPESPTMLPYISPVTAPTRKPGKRAWKQNAAASFRRKEELERLAAYRGMKDKDCRYLLLFYYGAAVREIEMCRTRNPKDAQLSALRSARKLNASFTEPLPQEDVAMALRSKGTSKVSKHKNTKIAAKLNVTDHEVDVLGLTSTVPAHIARKWKNENEAAAKMKQQKQAVMDHLLAKGLPIVCIAKITGLPASTIGTRKSKFLSDPQTIKLSHSRICSPTHLRRSDIHT